MKRLFKSKEANVITPLPLASSSQERLDRPLSQREYLPASPSPYAAHPPNGRGSGHENASKDLRASYAAQASHQDPRQQPHPHAPWQQRGPADGRGDGVGRPRSFQLFDPGPQPRQAAPAASPSHQQQRRHQLQPSAPGFPPSPPHDLRSVGSSGSHGSDQLLSSSAYSHAPADAHGVGGPVTANGHHAQLPSQGRSPRSAEGYLDTDSDDEAAYQQSRTLNDLVPRGNAAQRAPMYSDPPSSYPVNYPAVNHATRPHQQSQTQRSDPTAGSSRSSADRSFGSGRPSSRMDAYGDPADAGGPEGDRTWRDALGMRRRKSDRRPRAEDDAASLEREALADPQRSSRRFGRSNGAPPSTAYPVYAGHGEQDSETLLSTGSGNAAGPPGRSKNARQGVPEDAPSDREKSKGWVKGQKKLFGFGRDIKGAQSQEDSLEGDHFAASVPDERLTAMTADLRLDRHGADLPPAPASPAAADAGARSAAMSPPPPPGAPVRKEHWYDRKPKKKNINAVKLSKEAERELESIVSAKVGWLCAQPSAADDFDVVLSLAEEVSHSEAASKEAARALRKEIKYGTIESQKRAARIWAVLTVNSSDRFKLQIASKRFLDVVEETISSSKTPLSVKETLLRVLGVLAYEFSNDSELSSVTKCWNKVKPSDRPLGGEPMDPSLEEFALAGDAGGRRDGPAFSAASTSLHAPLQAGHLHQQSHGQQQLDSFSHPSAHRPIPPGHAEQQSSWPDDAARPSNLQPQLERPFDSGIAPQHPVHDVSAYAHRDPILGATTHQPSRTGQLPIQMQGLEALPHDQPNRPDADARRLQEESQIARSNANVLTETMLTEGLRSDTVELIDEFYGKVTASQDSLMSQVAWVSARADQSRDWVEQQRTAIAAAESRAVSAVSNEDLHLRGLPSSSTWQEQLLSDLLDAHGRCGEAARMVDEARRQAEADEEERRVTELSKVEVRVDRSALVEDPVTGDLFYNGNRAGGASDYRWQGPAHGSGNLGPGGGNTLAASSHASGSRSASPSHGVAGPGHDARAGGSTGAGSNSSTAAYAAAPTVSISSATSPSSTQTHASSPATSAAMALLQGQNAPQAPQQRASRPLPVPGSDRSSSNGHSHGQEPGGQKRSAGEASNRHSTSQASFTGSVGSGAGMGSTTHSREASSASSHLASRNPYAPIIGAGAGAADGTGSLSSSFSGFGAAPAEPRSSGPMNPLGRSSGEGGETASLRLVNPFDRSEQDGGNGHRADHSGAATSPPPPLPARLPPPLQPRPITIDTSVSAKPPPLPPHPSMTSSATSHQASNGGSKDEASKDDDDSSSILTPVVPSEKALGKRRQVSMREDDVDLGGGIRALHAAVPSTPGGERVGGR